MKQCFIKQMNLTTRQKQIYEKIHSVDSTWDEKSFAEAWNNILKLNNSISISNGKLILEFDDPNHATIKFEKNREIMLSEKIYLNELIKLDEKTDATKEMARSIKSLAEKIIGG